MRHAVLAGLAGLGLIAGSVEAGERITNPWEGVTHIHRTETSPRLLDINVVIIDTNAQGLGFKVTPSNGSTQGETTAQTPMQFLKQEGAQIAINGGFYDTSTWPYTNLIGIHASEGNVYSGGNSEQWAVLNISQDNAASVLVPNSATSTIYDVIGDVQPWNAIAGNERLVTNGVNTAGGGSHTNQLHPRTAGGVTADGKLVLVTIDGRDSTHSLGMSTPEVADLLISYGVRDGVNLDGGGSTGLVFADPTPRVVNKPSDGSLRSVANNLAVFAGAQTQPKIDAYVFSNFEYSEGTFSLAPGYSGSTRGLNESASSADLTRDTARFGIGSQKLVLTDDPNDSGGADNSNGWFVRHISGSSASASQNDPRPTTGWVGFWAMTEDAGVEVALAIDDNNVTAEQGAKKTLIADGKWHLYEWNLEDDAMWNAWVNGNGQVDSATFTLDSVMLFGANVDATVFIDQIAHNAFGSLDVLAEPIPEPGTLALLGLAGAAMLRRRRAA